MCSWALLSFSLWNVAKLLCSLVFVSLMQSLSNMLWMKKGSSTFLLESESGFYMQ